MMAERAALIEFAQSVAGTTEVNAIGLQVRTPATYTVQTGDTLWRRCFCAAQGGEKTADAGIGILCQQIVVAGQFLGQGFAKCFECVELVLPELEG